MSSVDPLQTIATVLFALAVIHTFLANRIHSLSKRFPPESLRAEVCQFFGEVEAVFPVWAAILFFFIVLLKGHDEAIQYSEKLDFKEPIFVFVIMVTAATRPIHRFAAESLSRIARIASSSRIFPLEAMMYLTALSIGPLLGSFITEPAAMTITAWILRDRYFERDVSQRFKYLTLATLFVNVSIGGVLTPYAAPPVLMVADKWGWGFPEMLQLFGWKAAIAVFINAGFATYILSKELNKIASPIEPSEKSAKMPIWLTTTHLLLLAGIVFSHHHAVFFVGFFLIFLAIVNITRKHHDELKLREGLLVAAFLGGLVVLGNFQEWWLQPLVRSLDATGLFLGTTALTAITDNAALTYLGSQIEGLSHPARYALMAGAVAGGGLTVIANAPNPAGYSILQESFKGRGIEPGRLLVYALIPTFVAAACLWGF